MTPLAVSRKSAAQMLSISLGSLDKLVASGQIRPTRLLGRKVVFQVSELERFLNRAANRERFAGVSR